MVFNALVDQPHPITVALNQESIDAGALHDTFITNDPNKVDLRGCGLPSTGILTGFGPLYSLSQGCQQIGREINEWITTRLDLLIDPIFGIINPAVPIFFLQWEKHREPDLEEDYYDWKIDDVIWRTWPAPQIPANIAKFSIWKSWLVALGSDHWRPITERIQAQVLERDPDIMKLLAEALRTTGELPVDLEELTWPRVVAVWWDIISPYYHEGAIDVNTFSNCDGSGCSAPPFKSDPAISGKMVELLRSYDSGA